MSEILKNKLINYIKSKDIYIIGGEVETLADYQLECFYNFMQVYPEEVVDHCMIRSDGDLAITTHDNDVYKSGKQIVYLGHILGF